MTGSLPVDMTGQRVLVTAAATGIGRMIAEGFASRGGRVHICDIDPKVEAAAGETGALSWSVTDVADPAAVDAMMEAVRSRFGGLEVLVNNAGIAGPTAGIEAVEPEPLRETLAVNVEGQFHCARRAVPMMRKAGGGCILNLASIAGRLAFPLRTPYAASKWGVIGFSRSLAHELGPEGIRVNAILPGHVRTERFRRVAAAKALALGVTPEEITARMLAPVALRRNVEMADIANMALYLASPFGASITAQAISVCGGVEMMG
jgi:NAD(P)-dependent dehydrogenase (short-subunit alcohol dehydrogenase family)